MQKAGIVTRGNASYDLSRNGCTKPKFLNYCRKKKSLFRKDCFNAAADFQALYTVSWVLPNPA